MSHWNLLGLLDNPLRFPDLLVTELGANCAEIHGAVHGFAEWLNKARSQLMEAR